jgi:hypothetical protein
MKYKSLQYYIWIYWEEFRCKVLNIHAWLYKDPNPKWRDMCGWCTITKKESKERKWFK